MSKDFYLEIAKMVEDGQYFRDAKDWYHSKYNFPVIERSFCIMFSIMAFIIMIVSVNILMSFFPLEKKIPISVVIADPSQTYSTLKKLSPKRDSDPDLVLQDHLLFKFVETFENYEPTYKNQKINKNITYTSTYAAEKISELYSSLVDLQNPDGYIIRYRNASRIATLDRKSLLINGKTIKQLELLEPEERVRMNAENNIHDATLDFTINEIYSSNKENTEYTSKYRAYIKYVYTNISYDRVAEDFRPLDFKILEYKTVEIK